MLYTIRIQCKSQNTVGSVHSSLFMPGVFGYTSSRIRRQWRRLSIHSVVAQWSAQWAERPDDGGSKHLRTSVNYHSDVGPQQSRRQCLSCRPPWEPEICAFVMKEGGITVRNQSQTEGSTDDRVLLRDTFSSSKCFGFYFDAAKNSTCTLCLDVLKRLADCCYAPTP
jgi:hypothetical protein